MSGKMKKPGRKTSLRISLEVTVAVLIVFIISSGVGLAVFQRSLNQLAENSKEEVVDSVASLVSSSHYFVARMIMYIHRLESGTPTYKQLQEEMKAAVADDTGIPSQELLSGLVGEMVDSGILGFEAGYFALPPTEGLNDQAVVVVSSDNKDIFSEVPEELGLLINSDKGYKLFEDGVPGTDFKGEYLVTTFKLMEENSTEEVFWYFDFKPMGELLSSIDGFYKNESDRAMWRLGAAVGISILAFIIISFAVLGYLIRKRIIKPMDELSHAAEKVIEGDMDVRVEIKPREEFSELKHAFNQMISSISGIVSRTLGRDSGESEKSGKAGAGAFLKPRATVLFQVIALFTIVFIAAGAFFMITVRSSMDSLVESSKESLIETQAELILSSHAYGATLSVSMNKAEGKSTSVDPEMIKGFISGIQNKEVSQYQKNMGETLRLMAEYDLFNYAMLVCIVPPGPLADDYMVVISSDEKFLYTKPPRELIDLFDEEEDSYVFFENGIPSMEINEPFLATSYRLKSTSLGSMEILLVDFKPMGEEVEAMDEFFDSENNDLTLTMGIVIGISTLLLILVTIFLLSYLIRKRITGPVDELVSAANAVMDGDLDVQVQVKAGEQLESLKTAFNKMIVSLRELIEKSMEE
ncbi:MAG: HAMP domain-containing protein [Actinobacteria bacterium]|nr:HAMP domain-containing protein [Actinomycetota bacterium]